MSLSPTVCDLYVVPQKLILLRTELGKEATDICGGILVKHCRAEFPYMTIHMSLFKQSSNFINFMKSPIVIDFSQNVRTVI